MRIGRKCEVERGVQGCEGQDNDATLEWEGERSA